MSVSGNVDQPVPGIAKPPALVQAGLVFTDTVAPIPGRGATVFTQSDAVGNFALTLAQSTWDVAVRPAGLPPLLGAARVSTSVGALHLTFPAGSELTNVTGKIVSAGVAVPNVHVGAITSAGEPLGDSVDTDAAGAFALLVPKGPLGPFYVQVGPKPDVPDSTIPTFSPRFINAPNPPTTNLPVGNIDVGALPRATKVTGRVLDNTGTPLANASVHAVSTDVAEWILSREVTTDAAGSYSMNLLEGHYIIEAVPDADPAQPALSGEVPVVLPSTMPVDILCPPKAVGTGTVVRPDGRAAGDSFQIIATRLPDRLVTGRAGIATPTDASGTFRLIADPGRYRVEIVPPLDAALPRTFVTVEIKGSGTTSSPEAIGPLYVAPPLHLFGTISRRSGATPIAGAAVQFFALDSTRARAVLIGGGLTDANGAYHAVVADLPNPAAP
jgi:hypothetical protein